MLIILFDFRSYIIILEGKKKKKFHLRCAIYYACKNYNFFFCIVNIF